MAEVTSALDVDLDRLCIDTIRTLSIDAVQKANSGHPGTPMGLAPVVYTLWTQFLRYDPADPLWPNRDRFVLSAGHASMLLYAMLHLAGVHRLEARRSGRRGPARGRPGGHQTVPAAGQCLSRPPRIPPDHRGRDHHRAAGPGLRQQCRHGHGRALAGGAAQHRRDSPDRLQHLCRLRRRRHDGGGVQRGGLDRRASETVQPLLDLRFQHHHHRRSHQSGLHRGRRRARLRRLWLERGRRWPRRQRLRGRRPRAGDRSRNRRSVAAP